MPETDDPLFLLEQAALRQEQEEKAAADMRRARGRLVLGDYKRQETRGAFAFFASLALKVDHVASWDVKTAATDGKTLVYNPEYVCGLSLEELVGLNVHEVAHLMLTHHARMESRARPRWNRACDLAINPLIRAAGFTLPPGAFYPGHGEHASLPEGKSAEEYYALLPDEGQEGQEGQEDDPGACGGVVPPGDQSAAAARQSEADWQVNVAQAEQLARQRGALPAGVERLVARLLRPKTDAWDLLREFVSRVARNDFSWATPNRRFISQGLYLPGMRSEELGEITVAIDTSGSIGDAVLTRFASELQGVLETFQGARLTLLYHDARVQHVHTWDATDGEVRLEPRGGGGTDHRPVFEWVAAQEEPPACLICLTDMASTFPDVAPPYPVLWLGVGAHGSVAPFGRLVEVE